MTKILLVEDDKSLREIYGVRLQAEGYEIVSAGDGEEALAIAIKERPGLIVSDVMMPKISGFDMLDILRSTTETKDIKVIMMTALSSDDQRARGESLGADRYLVKSQVGIEDVVRTVHEVLGDGVPGAAPAAPSFPPATPAPVETPVAPTPVTNTVPEPVVPSVPAPTPEPIATPAEPLAPAPVAATPVINTPPAPVPTPEPTPIPMPEPLAPVAPIEQPAEVPAPAPTPLPTPEPIATPAPQTPPTVTLPEPTAPFSSPAPASLGDRVINPLPSAESLQQAPNDIAAQMNQELAGASTPPAATPPPPPPPPPMPPVPPAPTV